MLRNHSVNSNFNFTIFIYGVFQASGLSVSIKIIFSEIKIFSLKNYIFSDKKNIYECVNQNFCFFLIFDVKNHVFSYVTGRTLQDQVFILMKKNKSKAYSEHCQISTIERFAKFENMLHLRYLAGFRMRIRK